MKKPYKIHWQKSMIITLALIIFITAGSFVLTGQINKMEEDKAFDRLYEEAGELSDEIKAYAEKDKEQLEMLSAIISRYDDMSSKELWEVIDSYKTLSMMSRFEILLPNNTVITKGGKTIDANGILSFNEIASLGHHITNKEIDVLNGGGYILRHYIPIVKGDNVIAMLYGVIDLENMPDDLLSGFYGGKAAVYLIDGNTGDFLVDTWHSELGNIWALGERKMAPGYDNEKLKQGLIDGKSDYVVFVSETTGEHLYFYYKPLSINNWRIAVSVPEDVVFESANTIKEILNIFLMFEAIGFISYFLWMISYVKDETSEKQRQLDTINYIYEVERLLFNAHEKKENIIPALEKIGHMVLADEIYFWMLGYGGNDISFEWSEKNESSNKNDSFKKKSGIYRLFEYFSKGNSEFESDNKETLSNIFPAGIPENVKNVLSVPVEDINGKVCGILSAYNVANRKNNEALLKSVCFSLSMFCHNMRSYYAIKEQGERDILTGLYNRNRYEIKAFEYINKYKKSLACIYIDVNGLHELNNNCGHDAGDRMLKAVASEIREKFGDDNTYRIGGDEFVAFAIDFDENTVTGLCNEIEKELKLQDYHVSIGIQWEKEVSSMNLIIKSAEKKMYLAKKAYYEQTSNNRRHRI